MTTNRITTGSKFEEDIGYCRAIIKGGWAFISGTTGFNYKTMAISDCVVEQTRQSLQNIEIVLVNNGFHLSDIVRVLYIYPEIDDFRKSWQFLSQYFSDFKPTATMISAGLADTRMKVEIEVTAFRDSV